MHKSNFITIRSVGAELFHAERQTDGQKDERADTQTYIETHGQA